MTSPFDFKYVKRHMPDMLDEIFNIPPTRLELYRNEEKIALQETDDILSIALEIPRLDPSTISVSVEKQAKRTFEYDLTVEAGEILLDAYLSDCENKALKTYKKVFKIETSRPVALDGDLNLEYNEGVLCVHIPLQSPQEPKKQGLSARLSDIKS